jgi:hypothetical protein
MISVPAVNLYNPVTGGNGLASQHCGRISGSNKYDIHGKIPVGPED